MQVRDRRTGQMVELPDEYDDDQILGHFSTQGQQAPSLAQSFIGGIQQQAGAGLAQQLAQGPAQSTLPNIGGGAMVGLTPQQAQFTLQQAQQSNVDSMQQKMEQQKMTEQGIESEKDRAQTLKLRQQELKNLVAQKKIQADIDKFEAEQKTLGKGLDAQSKMQIEQMRQEGRQKVEEGKLYNLNGQLTDRQGNVIADNTRAPSAGGGLRTQVVPMAYTDPDTNEEYVVNTLVNLDNGETIRELGNVANKTSGGSGGGIAGEVTNSNWFTHGPEVMDRNFSEYQKSENENATQNGRPAPVIDAKAWKDENEPRIRKENMLKPFRDVDHATGWVAKMTEKKKLEISETVEASLQYKALPGGKIKPNPTSNDIRPGTEKQNANAVAEVLAPLYAQQEAAALQGVRLDLVIDEDGTAALQEK